MTIENTTPTGDTNQPQAPEQPIDNDGNPVNPDGTPAETPNETPEESSQDLESLQKALKDTKAELTRLQQANAESKPEETPNETPSEETLEIQKKEAEEAGVDFSKYTDEINSAGELSEDSYKELEGKGYPKEVVDAYIEGQRAINQRNTSEVAEVVGGEENFNKVKEWAAVNLSETQLDAYNKAVKGGTESAKLALQGIYSQYQLANGKAPNLITGDTAPGSNDVFKSPYEMTKAQEDPRYWSDPDYQKDVAAKIERSHKAGTI